jgi:hypothetical protein
MNSHAPPKRSAPGREIAGAAKLRLTESYQTFGTSQLCVWRDAPRVCRFQTRNPVFARKLSQRSKACLVAFSVSGGYLRVFEERIQPWRALALVRRYLAPANSAFCDAITAPARLNQAGGPQDSGRSVMSATQDGKTAT